MAVTVWSLERVVDFLRHWHLSFEASSLCSNSVVISRDHKSGDGTGAGAGAVRGGDCDVTSAAGATGARFKSQPFSSESNT